MDLYLDSEAADLAVDGYIFDEKIKRYDDDFDGDGDEDGDQDDGEFGNEETGGDEDFFDPADVADPETVREQARAGQREGGGVKLSLFGVEFADDGDADDDDGSQGPGGDDDGGDGGGDDDDGGDGGEAEEDSDFEEVDPLGDGFDEAEPDMPPGALFAGDKGRFPVGARTALCKLLLGPYIDRNKKQRNYWPDLVKYQSVIEKWLGEVFLDLVLDNDLGVAFIRQIDVGELSVAAPALLRTKRLNFWESILVVFLREKLFEAETGSHRATVDEAEMFEYMRSYESKENTDQLRTDEQIKAAVNNLASKLYLLRKTSRGGDLYEISPTLKLIMTPEDIESFTKNIREAGEQARRATEAQAVRKRRGRRRGRPRADEGEQTDADSPPDDAAPDDDAPASKTPSRSKVTAASVVRDYDDDDDYDGEPEEYVDDDDMDADDIDDLDEDDE
ncbi:MAG: DUF4194 domain-containing protein [Deltaproteobacteria bacterium]|nr:DUF4194 domain-containing protein [Deltaproteobacteria bacterium]